MQYLRIFVEAKHSKNGDLMGRILECIPCNTHTELKAAYAVAHKYQQLYKQRRIVMDSVIG